MGKKGQYTVKQKGDKYICTHSELHHSFVTADDPGEAMKKMVVVMDDYREFIRHFEKKCLPDCTRCKKKGVA